MTQRVAVLGAGPTGLSAAWKLAQRDFEVDVIEKMDVVGGLSASIKRGDFIVDYGPHNFHVKKGDSHPLISSIYDFELKMLERKTRMLLGDKVYTYPFKLSELVLGIPPLLTIRIILSYLKQKAKNIIAPVPADSFEAWGINNFGPVLYDLCFGSYSAKVWGMPPSKLSIKLGKQKVVNKLSLAFFIKSMLGLNRNLEQFTHYQQFIYPPKGCGHFYEELAQSVKNMGGRINLNSSIQKIIIKDGKMHAIAFTQNGSTKKIEYDGLVSSIPLYSLINLLEPAPSADIVECANRLKYRALILVYLVLEKKSVTDAQLIYLLDKKFKCNRITEQKNFSPKTIPENQTVITFERCCNKGDELWNASDQQLYEMVLEEIPHLSQFFEKGQIKDYFVIRLDDVYPIYDVNYHDNLKEIFDYIAGIPNLVITGRNGLFLNNDMHECIILGVKGAQLLINEIKGGGG